MYGKQSANKMKNTGMDEKLTDKIIMNMIVNW